MRLLAVEYVLTEWMNESMHDHIFLLVGLEKIYVKHLSYDMAPSPKKNGSYGILSILKNVYWEREAFLLTWLYVLC